MKKVVCGAVLALLLIPARAQAGWWDWFDQLSGPGPFTTSAIYWSEFRIAGIPKPPIEGQPEPLLAEALATDDPDILRWLVTLRYVAMSNEKQRGTPNNPVDIRLAPFDVAVSYRFAPFVDVGGGVSVLTFSGQGFDTFSRVGLLLPKITLTPLALVPLKPGPQRTLLRSFKFYIDVTWTKSFSAADFNNAVPPFPSDHNHLTRMGFVIDFATLGYGVVKLLHP
jgi:hypothetical protein